MKGVQVDIRVSPDVKPKYFRALPVPYSIKDNTEPELDRIVKLGIYKPVNSAKWAAPIIPVFKGNSSTRLCGYYSQTVNQAADYDKYPVPKTEDIFANFYGGDKFSKLNLSLTYQQILLSPDSGELLTVNTHKGLFQSTRLQFEVHSASGSFSENLKAEFLQYPFVKVRSNDILRGESHIDFRTECVIMTLAVSGLLLMTF